MAAVASAPLLAAGAAGAQVQITTSTTTPVATATASNGAPADIVITSSGSIAPTSPTAAVTLNSNNTVTNNGSIGLKDQSNSEGILVLGGFTGQVISTGSITLTESYAPTTSTTNGLPQGAFAQGSDRYGIEVTGPGIFTGGITATGAITIQGNTSDNILIDAPITGPFIMETVTPATSTSSAVVAIGTYSITGDHSVGVHVTPTGGVGGNVEIQAVSATGVGARAVVIDGAVGGGINIAGAVTATGYRSTTFNNIPSLLATYTPDQLQQGGSAVKIGADVAHGLLISAPPPIIPPGNTTADADKNGVPDFEQTTGAVSSFGSAPALKIGAVGKNVTLGTVIKGTGPTPYGIVVQGSVNANGVYDTVSTTQLPGPVPATAMQIGFDGSGATVIQGGIHNSGAIDAAARQADTTAIHIGSGATVDTINNHGFITASSLQVTNLTTGFVPLNTDAILIHKGATVTTINNSNEITANLTGSAGLGGNIGAIVDKSGTITTVNNSGQIAANAIQTVVSAPMPFTATAIDISGGNAPQSITQTLSAVAAKSTPFSASTAYAQGALVNFAPVVTTVSNTTAVAGPTNVYEALTTTTAGQDPGTYPTLWRQVGVLLPTISGAIKFGNGGSTLTVDAGTVIGAIDLGAGVNTINVNGPSTTTSVVGAISDEGGQFGANIASGVLADTNPSVVNARFLDVGATGGLIVAADPAHGANTKFVLHGPGVFAQGAQIGLTLDSLQSAPSATYTIVKTTTGGSLSAGTFTSGTLATTPFLYDASAAFVPSTGAGGPSKIELTVTRKTAAELGFNASEAAALDSILQALPANAAIQSSVLAQTDQAGLKSVYDQLLPNQGQGLFEALDAAAQTVSLITANDPNAGTKAPGSSLWLQEVNERVDRKGLESQGSRAKLLGLVGGYERPIGRGNVGLELAYMNDQEQDNGSAVGEHVVASMLELGVYYRQAIGPLMVSARGGGGYSWFSSDRRFLAPGAFDRALSNWGGYFADGHLQVSYEHRFGRFYGGPQASLDYLYLKEDAHAESGGGAGFDLTMAGRSSDRLSGEALMVVGTQFGAGSWLRTELRAGWRQVFSGQIGDTIASFDGGSPFTLTPDSEPNGWATIGLSIKAGSPYSYVALEGDGDFRNGEERYDVIVAGRSVF